MSRSSSSFESLSGKVDTSFPDSEAAMKEPVSLAREWLREAEAEQVREPRSMVFSTTNGQGELTSRVMSILDFNDDGVIFATHRCSRKIRDISRASSACGHFYWRELGRQLSIGGVVTELSREFAEAVWSSRPVPLHSMSTASRQSLELESSEALMAVARELETQGALPCPEHFAVYVLKPRAIEFWAARSDRLHRRLRFNQYDGVWKSMRLQP